MINKIKVIALGLLLTCSTGEFSQASALTQRASDQRQQAGIMRQNHSRLMRQRVIPSRIARATRTSQRETIASLSRSTRILRRREVSVAPRVTRRARISRQQTAPRAQGARRIPRTSVISPVERVSATPLRTRTSRVSRQETAPVTRVARVARVPRASVTNSSVERVSTSRQSARTSRISEQEGTSRVSRSAQALPRQVENVFPISQRARSSQVLRRTEVPIAPRVARSIHDSQQVTEPATRVARVARETPAITTAAPRISKSVRVPRNVERTSTVRQRTDNSLSQSHSRELKQAHRHLEQLRATNRIEKQERNSQFDVESQQIQVRLAASRASVIKAQRESDMRSEALRQEICREIRPKFARTLQNLRTSIRNVRQEQERLYNLPEPLRRQLNLPQRQHTAVSRRATNEDRQN